MCLRLCVSQPWSQPLGDPEKSADLSRVGPFDRIQVGLCGLPSHAGVFVSTSGSGEGFELVTTSVSPLRQSASASVIRAGLVDASQAVVHIRPLRVHAQRRERLPLRRRILINRRYTGVADQSSGAHSADLVAASLT